MKRVYKIIIIFVVSVTFLSNSFLKKNSFFSQKYGQETENIIDNFSQIQSFKLNGWNIVYDSSACLQKYSILEKGPILDFSQSEILLSVLKDSINHNWDSNAVKACPYSPNIGFQFISETGSITLSIMTDCGLWKIETASDSLILSNCDNANNVLLQLSQELFPNDQISSMFPDSILTFYIIDSIQTLDSLRSIYNIDYIKKINHNLNIDSLENGDTIFIKKSTEFK